LLARPRVSKPRIWDSRGKPMAGGDRPEQLVYGRGLQDDGHVRGADRHGGAFHAQPSGR